MCLCRGTMMHSSLVKSQHYHCDLPPFSSCKVIPLQCRTMTSSKFNCVFVSRNYAKSIS
ncbi:hypothetical protein ACMBCN_00435 [Candidatus Liberibacter asiaticus]|nr:hypothetical protein [Candidatus Liberibacter asiaticus]